MTSDSSEPLVSIIIPAHNYAHYIGETLDSVRAQTYQSWECIVVDDGSKDNLREVVAQYMQKDPRIRYIYQRNQGPAAARNRGLKSFKGEYVQFWDSDDLIEPLKLESHVRYLEERPDIDIVYSNVRYFRTEEPNERRYSMWEPDVPWMPEVSGAGKDVLSVILSSNIMVVSAPLLRKSVIEAIGYFDNSLNPVEDWDYWIRCIAADRRIQYLDSYDTLTLVRSHPTSLNKYRKRASSAVILLRQKINRTFTDGELLALNRNLLQDLEKTLREESIRAAVEEIKTGAWHKAMRNLVRIASCSQSYREKAKWLFCALVAPVAPKEGFETVIAAPVSESILKISRHYLRY
jgi:glycosyltransferase involved in cell wall biosynthesis